MSVSVATGLLIGSSIATGVGAIGSAKMRSGAARKVAKLESESAADQLAYIKNEARMDRESQRWASRQNYGLSTAEGMNAFNRFGDTAFNTRASELSRGRSEDKRYGATQHSLNTMRALMGMPDKSLVSYVRPDALRLTAPTFPEYVEDPTQQYIADNAVVKPSTTNYRRL